MEIEIRSLPGKAEVRTEGETRSLVGTAIEWNALSSDLGDFREKFAPGSITLNDDTRVVWQHNNSYVFGRVGAGTAKFTVDERGAHYTATPPDAQWARDAMESIRRGDVYQNSFKFSIPEPRKDNEEWKRSADGGMVRTIKKAHIYEMGPQTEPAYPSTTVALRGLSEALAAEKVVEPAPVSDAVLAEQARLAGVISAGFDP